jgi:predicted RNA-binding protein with PIN domain
MFWMSLLSFKTTLLVLVVVVVVMLGTTIIIFPLVSFAYHGQEISILLDSAEFIPPSENGEENQVNVFVNYTVNDPSLINQRINSVMKVYSTNGTLIKTSSSAEGFTINQTGSERHATLITNNTLHNVIAVVQFTNLTKTVPLSSPLQTNLTLSEAQVTPETETRTEIAALQL